MRTQPHETEDRVREDEERTVTLSTTLSRNNNNSRNEAGLDHGKFKSRLQVEEILIKLQLRHHKYAKLQELHGYSLATTENKPRNGKRKKQQSR